MRVEKEEMEGKIRRDEGELFTITEHTRVCSLHFTGDDYRKIHPAIENL